MMQLKAASAKPLRICGRHSAMLTATLTIVVGLAGGLAACSGLPGTASGTPAETAAKAGTAAQLDPQIKLAALRAESQNNYLEAAQHYQSLLTRDPENLDLAVSLARNLRFAGSSPQDIDILNQLILKHGRSPKLLTELGKSYIAGDKMNLAIPLLQEAAAVPGATWDTFSALGVAYDYQNDFLRAREAYTQALLLSPSNPEILNNLALSQAQSGDLEGAIQTLDMAVDQASASPQVRQNLALMLALKGDTAGAERMARKDLPKELADENAEYYRYLASGD
ncbi:tetratricopeptide repeat protein [Dongia sp.]|uniref:tetratricopeptide repeat protein n=1 Tax=Dongia sp. TaxID=1977262 RepID=UPI0035B28775